MRLVHRPALRAFTLVEMLVVIGIIALLLALLLPALNKARAAANSVVCLSRLRALGQAMFLYTQQYDGYLPGSGWSSSRHIWNDGGAPPNTYNTIHTIATPGIGVCGQYDYIAPLVSILHLSLDCPPDANGKLRFDAYRKLEVFLCPANAGQTAVPNQYAPVGMTEGQMLSYATAASFMLKSFRQQSYSGLVHMPAPPPLASYWELPSSYCPRISRIGNPSAKIFLADAARLTPAGESPNFTVGLANDHLNSPFTDFGPFWGLSKSYDRSYPNGVSTDDPRHLAYRHGTRHQFATTGSYRLNAVFYDGHAESLDDLASANPALWLPRGTLIYNPASTYNTGPTPRPIIWPDVAAHYLPGVTNTKPYLVP